MGEMVNRGIDLVMKKNKEGKSRQGAIEEKKERGVRSKELINHLLLLTSHFSLLTFQEGKKIDRGFRLW